jgi:hypothetical protein
LRHALERAFDGDRGQIVRARGAQCAFGCFADSRADGAYDDSIFHD